MHYGEHFLSKSFLFGSEIAVYFRRDSHEVKDYGLHKLGEDPICVIRLLAEMDNTDVKRGFVAGSLSHTYR